MKKVQVVLDNRFAYIEAPSAVYDDLRDFWSFSVPGAKFMPAVKEGRWDGRIRFLTRNRLPAGLFRATYVEAAETLSLVFQIRREMVDIDCLHVPAATDPKYAYQPECIQRMLEAAPQGGGIVLAATSAGKTRIAAGLMQSMQDYKFLFVVDQLNLLYQAQEEIASFLNYKVGVVGDSEFDPSRITIATIQTLNAHSRKAAFKKWLQTLDVVIVDELHEQLAKRDFSVVKTIEPLAVFGLTATLELTKKEVRYKAFALAGPVIFQYTVEEGMKSGVLNRGAVLQLVFDEVDWNSDNHWEEYDVQVIENNIKLEAARLITEYLARRERHIVHLVARISHLDALSDKLVPMKRAVLWGGVKKDAREIAVDRFEAGRIPLLIANQVMKKGVSINVIDVIIDMAEMKSRNDAVQKFGRGLRKIEDETPLLYIDFGTRSYDVVRNGKVKKNEQSTAAKARIRAFRKANIPVRRIAIHSAEEALKAVKKILKMYEPQQQELFR